MKAEFTIALETLWDGCKGQEHNNYKSCIHSGNAGDMIYSLPTVKMLGAEHFIINLCSDPTFGGLGGRSINLDIARSLCPLLLEQPYIKRVSIVQSNIPLEFAKGNIEGVDFVLDQFRLQDVFKHHLAICHASAFKQHVNLFEKWLSVDSNHKQNNDIVIAFTPRYRSLSSEYWLKALSGLDNIKVLGLSGEFCLSAGITADFVTCSDFLEMANIIANAKLFIGNPSLAYAIAEGLKVPRIVEVPESPRNAYPIGKNGYIASDSIAETRDLIEYLLADHPAEILQFKNVTLLKKIALFEDQKHNLENEKRNLEAQLQNIHGSLGWRLMCKHYKVRDKLFPIGTKRRRFVLYLKSLVVKQDGK